MIFNCKNCSSKLRFPIDKRIKFTCPECGKRYIFDYGKDITFRFNLKGFVQSVIALLVIVLVYFAIYDQIIGKLYQVNYGQKKERTQIVLANYFAENYYDNIYDSIDTLLNVNLESLNNAFVKEKDPAILNIYLLETNFYSKKEEIKFKSFLFDEIYSLLEKKINSQIDRYYEQQALKLEKYYPSNQLKNNILKCIADNLIHSNIKDNLHSANKEISRALILNDSIEKDELYTKIDIETLVNNLKDATDCFMDIEYDFEEKKRNLYNSRSKLEAYKRIERESKIGKDIKLVKRRLKSCKVANLQQSSLFKTLVNWDSYYLSTITDPIKKNQNLNQLFIEYLNFEDEQYIDNFNWIRDNPDYSIHLKTFLDDFKYESTRTRIKEQILIHQIDAPEEWLIELQSLLSDWEVMKNSNLLFWHLNNTNIEWIFNSLLNEPEKLGAWGFALYNQAPIPLSKIPKISECPYVNVADYSLKRYEYFTGTKPKEKSIYEKFLEFESKYRY